MGFWLLVPGVGMGGGSAEVASDARGWELAARDRTWELSDRSREWELPTRPA